MKTFQFPPFETWDQTKQFRQKIGAYTCEIGAFSMGIHGSSTYVAAISTDDNPLNIYADKIMAERLEIARSEKGMLRAWYEKVTSVFNKKWEAFLKRTYFED